MILEEMVIKLRIPCLIEIRDSNNISICEALSDSKGVDPYIDCKVVEWFIRNANTVCVLIDDEADIESDNINLCDDCKYQQTCNPTSTDRDGVNTIECSKYEHDVEVKKND